MTQLEATIQAIIQNIPQGDIFDAHSIIDFLIQNNSDVYLDSYRQGMTTKVYHSQISKIINSFANPNDNNRLLDRLGGNIWSRNIHQHFTNNAPYRRR